MNHKEIRCRWLPDYRSLHQLPNKEGNDQENQGNDENLSDKSLSAFSLLQFIGFFVKLGAYSAHAF